ncbi:MAG: VIT1/CCC1 transporter family protein [Alphaproteobacteria bacterium]|nr:VIT1/CCC1 transporter family protein [Alphaproteobacteria bacterium]MDD9919285.1 VIT1/CCC1 transporter family protein [Alphaproteobacteria bacterium]
MFSFRQRRKFKDLTEQEILALAITAEEEDGRTYADYANNLKEEYPATAKMFMAMAAEENEHRRQLIERYQTRFGEHIPLLKREDISGFIKAQPLWKVMPLGPDAMRLQAQEMEQQAQRFYEAAAKKTADAQTRKLLGDLAEAEAGHEHTAGALEEEHVPQDEKQKEREHAHRKFVLEVVQPGLAGLMDGSVSTLAPLFAAAFATQNSWDTFLVGMAASVGAGISMGFAEALSDDGEISGRGSPWVRGVSSGIMTTIGGIGHTLPYLIPDVHIATTLAVAVVSVELLIIAWIRHKFMDSPWGTTLLQIVLGGVLVFLAGILIGNA